MSSQSYKRRIFSPGTQLPPAPEADPGQQDQSADYQQEQPSEPAPYSNPVRQPALTDFRQPGIVDPRRVGSDLAKTYEGGQQTWDQYDKAVANQNNQIAQANKEAEKTRAAQMKAQEKATKAQEKQRQDLRAIEFSSEGKSYDRNPDGSVQQAVDPLSGKPVVNDLTSPVQYDQAGRAYQVERRDGTMKQRFLDAEAPIGPNPKDPQDPFIYRQNKHQKWEAIDPNEGVLSPDPAVRGASARSVMDRHTQSLNAEAARLKAELSSPELAPATKGLEDAQIRKSGGTANAADEELLQRHATRQQKQKRLADIGVEQADLSTKSAEQFAQEKLAGKDTSAIQNRLATEGQARFAALHEGIQKELTTLISESEALQQRISRGYTAGESPDIIRQRGSMKVRTAALQAKQDSLNQSMKDHSDWMAALHKEATDKATTGVPQTDKPAPAEKPGPRSFEALAEAARNEKTTWKSLMKQEQGMLDVMKADPSMQEATAVKERWQRVLESLDPQASEEDANAIDSATQQATREIAAATRKDEARAAAARDAAKQAYDNSTNPALNTEGGYTDESGNFQPFTTPEDQKAADEHAKANFIGPYSDKPANYSPWGDLTVNPAFIFKPDAYTKAVDDVEAPPLAKERAMVQLNQLQQQAAPPVFEGFLLADGIHNDFQNSIRETIKKRGWEKTAFRGTTETMVKNWTPEQKAAAVQDFMDSKAYSPNANQIYLGLSQGLDQIQQQGYGIASFLGSDAAQKAGEEELRQQQSQGAASAVAGGSKFLNTLTSGATSLAPSLGIGLISGGAGAAFGLSGEAATGAALAANSVAAGMQSAGATMIEAKQAGYGEVGSRMVALGSGLITGGLTRLGGATGTEAIFSKIFQGGEQVAMAAVRPAFTKLLTEKLKGYAVDGLKEALIEEVPDELLQNILKSATYQPNQDIGEGLVDTFLVSFLLGGGVNAMTDAAKAAGAKMNAGKLQQQFQVRMDLGQAIASQHSPQNITEALAGSPLEAETPQILAGLADIDQRIVAGRAELAKATSNAGRLYSTKQLAEAYGERLQFVQDTKHRMAESYTTAALSEIDSAQPPPVTDPALGMASETPESTRAFEEDKARARALVTIASGGIETLDSSALALVDLTRDETGAVAPLKGKTTSPDGQPRIVMQNGQPIISQGTVDRAVGLFPAMAPLLRPEMQQRQTATPAADPAATDAPGTVTETKQPAATPSPNSTEAKAGPATQQEFDVTIDGVAEPVRVAAKTRTDAIAQVAAEGRGMVRDAVAVPKAATPAATEPVGQKAQSSKENSQPDFADAITAAGVARGLEATPERTTRNKALAKALVSEAKRWQAAFPGGVRVRSATNSGGVQIASTDRALEIDFEGLAASAESTKGNAAEWARLVIQEEVIHSAALELEKGGKLDAAAIYNALPAKVQRTIRQAYATSKDPRNLGHEFIRFIVQGRLAMGANGWTMDGTAVTTEQASPTLKATIKRAIETLLGYLKDFRKRLEKAGASAETITAIDDTVSRIESRLLEFEGKTAPAPEPKAEPGKAKPESKPDWQTFDESTGTLAVPRAEMPQVASGDRSSLVQFLRARGIDYTEETVPADSLKPTQAEYSQAKVDAAKQRIADGEAGDRALLVSQDGYVLDGHHQWLARSGQDVRILRLNAPVRAALAAIAEFPSVDTAGGASDVSGKPTAITQHGVKLTARFAVRERASLLSSHDYRGRKSEGYDQSLQPRDRSLPEYQKQSQNIARELSFDQAAYFPDTNVPATTPDLGAPVIDAGGQVIVGNGRYNGIAMAYGEGFPSAAKYKAEFVRNAKTFGLDPKAIEAMSEPVLVRVLDPADKETVIKFSQGSNEGVAMRTNAVELAGQDAQRLAGPARTVLGMMDPNYDLEAKQNEAFRQAYVTQVIAAGGSNEANLTGSELASRIRMGIFASAYGLDAEGRAALARMAGETDDGAKKITGAMLTMAAGMGWMKAEAQTGNLYERDISADLGAAAQRIAVALRDKPAKTTAAAVYEGLLAQPDALEDPMVNRLMQFMVENRANRGRIEEVLSNYVEGVVNLGNPAQADMFGDEPAGREALWARAIDPATGTDREDRHRLASQALQSQPFVSDYRRFITTADQMSVQEFAAAALEGRLNKASGKIAPNPSGTMKTPLSLGYSEGYSMADIAHFYVSRHVLTGGGFTEGPSAQVNAVLKKSEDPYQPEVYTAFDRFMNDAAIEVSEDNKSTALQSQSLDPRILQEFGADWEPGFDDWGMPNGPRTLPDSDPLLQPTNEKETVDMQADHPLVTAGLISEGVFPRRRMHLALKKFFMDQAKPLPAGTAPVVYLTGGGGGAGKSSIMRALNKQGRIDSTNAITVNADDIKELIPEYESLKQAGDSRGAAVVHEESSKLAKDLVAILLASARYNVIYDATLANPGKALPLIQSFKSAGFETHLVGVTIEPEEALIRASLRAKSSGRWVPTAALVEAHAGFNASIEDYFKMVDRADLYDNTPPSPTQVSKKSAPTGTINIVNSAAHDKVALRQTPYEPKSTTTRSDPRQSDGRGTGGRTGTGQTALRPVQSEGQASGNGNEAGLSGQKPLGSQRTGDLFEDWLNTIPAAELTQPKRVKERAKKELPPQVAESLFEWAANHAPDLATPMIGNIMIGQQEAPKEAESPVSEPSAPNLPEPDTESVAQPPASPAVKSVSVTEAESNDFFPTPSVIRKMLEEAGTLYGKRILDPSAGRGDIADAVKSAGGNIFVIEKNPELQQTLKDKGHRVIFDDFLKFGIENNQRGDSDIKKGDEEWRPVAQFESIYEVSSWGRIKRIKDSKGAKAGDLLSPSKRKDGYMNVMLSDNGKAKSMLVHQLVAQAFLGVPIAGAQVNHKHSDGDKSRNWVSNLEYSSSADNNFDQRVKRPTAYAKGDSHPKSKLTEAELPGIRERLKNGDPIQSIADDTGVTYGTIHAIHTGRSRIENPEQFDTILLTPPFEDGQDMDHVQKAFSLLKPGGRLVAVMSEGSFGRTDRKSIAFKNWLETNGGISERLPEGSFKSAFRSTGVATRLVTLDKDSAALSSQSLGLSRTKNGGNRVDFANPVISGVGEISAYQWQSKLEEYFKPDGESVARRVSDWDKAQQNAETGRDIVHQFMVKSLDGEKVVSLETAMGVLGKTTPIGKAVKSAVTAARRLATREAELFAATTARDDWDTQFAQIKSQMTPPEPSLSEPTFSALKEQGKMEARVGNIQAGIVDPTNKYEWPLSGPKLEMAQNEWWRSQMSAPPPNYGRISDLQRLLKRDRQKLESAQKEIAKANTELQEQESALLSQSFEDALRGAGFSLTALDDYTTAAESEVSGERTVGNPDLSLGGGTAGHTTFGDPVIMGVDAYRAATITDETMDQWDAAAAAMLRSDYEGTARWIIENGMQGGQLTPELTRAAQMIVETESRMPMNSTRQRRLQSLVYAYRQAGTEQARGLAARRDPFKTPEQRNREFLAKQIFTPPADVRRKMEAAATPAERQKVIDDDGRRIRKIQVELAKMGVTLEDLFGGGVQLSLRNAAMVKQAAASLGEKESRAAILLQDGSKGFIEIAQAVGLTPQEVRAVKDKMKAKLAEQLRAMRDRAKAAKSLASAPLSSAPADLIDVDFAAMAEMSDEDAEAEIQNIIRRMGYFPDKQQGKRKTVKRKRRLFQPPAAAAAGMSVEDYAALPPLDNHKGTQAGLGMPPTPTPGMTVDEYGQMPIQPAKDATQPKLEGLAPAADNSIPPGEGKIWTRPARNQDELGLGIEEAVEMSVLVGADLANIEDTVRLARMAQAIDGKPWDMIQELWINNLLSGPMTQVTNITGNLAASAWEMTVQRGMEAAFNLIAQDEKGAQFGEFAHIAKALRPGIARGFALMAKAWRTETDWFAHDILNNEPELFETGPKGEGSRTAIPGRAGRIIRIPGRALMAVDGFFKGTIAQLEASAQAYRIAKAEGLSGESMQQRMNALLYTPGSQAWQLAAEKATELTFQTELPDSLKPLQQWKNSNRLLGFILPFIRTPYNIFRAGVRKSPVGAANLVWQMTKHGLVKLTGGRVGLTTSTKPEMMKYLAEQTIAYAALSLLKGAAEGDDDDDKKFFLITGSAPMDRAQRDLQERINGGSYVIRIGNLRIPYGRIEPLASVLGTTIDALRIAKSNGDAMEKLGIIAGALKNAALDKTFLSGLGSVFDALDHPGKLADKGKNFLLTALVPNLIRQPVRNMDPFIRDGTTAEWWYTLLPLGEGAEARVNTATGEDKQKTGNAATRLLFPALVETGPVQKSDIVLQQWNQANPNDSYAPAPPKPQQHIKIDGKAAKIELNAQAYHYLSQRSGVLAKNALSGLDLKPTEEGVKRIRDAYEDARRRAWSELKGRPPEQLGEIVD